MLKISTSSSSLFSFQCCDFIFTAYVTLYYYYQVSCLMMYYFVFAVFLRALHRSLFWFCTDGYGFQEPRVQMVRGYGLRINAVGAWVVPEKLGLLRSGLRSLVKSTVWLRCGLRFQVKSAGRFRSGLHSTSFVPNCDISHAFNFRYAFTATYKLFYISTSTVSPAAASCADCTSWRHWLRLSCCAAMTALYF